jgi:SAM-dependent methyltransferase
VDDVVRFDTDLYRGSAGYYDRYRLPYPESMLTDLIRRARISGSGVSGSGVSGSGVSGRGRLLDLACGTGQLAFPLRRWFGEVWAVDREPDMVEMVRAKAAAQGAEHVRPVVSDAETLDAEPGYFVLAVIGNAFHRLNRDLVAGRILGWLEPGGYLALCWTSGPYGPHAGEEDWQRALAAVVGRWTAALGAEGRVPAGWNLPRERRPDPQVLSDAGFEVAGHHEFAVEHRWSVPELAGYIRSTSFLPASVLGDQAAAFDADLAASLGPHSDGPHSEGPYSDGPYGDGGAFTQTVSFAYDLARKPVEGVSG